MATRTRENAPAKDPKRRTNPLNLPRNTATTTQHKNPNDILKTASPKTSPKAHPSNSLKTSSPKAHPGNILKTTSPKAHPNNFLKTTSPKPQTHGSISSNKNIPNYRNPAKTPLHDVPKQPDKNASVSRTPKPRVSLTPTPQSSSLPSRTIASQKSILDRSLNPSKDVGKQHSVYARPVKKVSSSIEKHDSTQCQDSTTKKAQVISPAEKVEIPSQPDHVPQIQDQKSCIPEAEKETEQVNESNNDKGFEAVVTKDQEQVDNTIIKKIEAEVDKDPKLVTIESFAEDKSHIEENNSNRLESDKHAVNEIKNISSDQEISVASHSSPEIEENKIQESAVQLDKKEVREEEKKETENKALKQHGSGTVQGKKDSVVSNNVIEETASKLREQRKNKVKALAGAFETVISLQEHK